MGKGSKDKARLIGKDCSEPYVKKSLGSDQRQVRHGVGRIEIPPGIPECDIILKGNQRFWYLEPALVIFGVAGFIVSGTLFLRYYFNI